MQSGSNSAKVFLFDEFRLEPMHGKLWRGEEQIPLTPKAIELLSLLIERRGETLSKDEILDNLWHDTFVDENNLAVTVSMLRRAMGEGAHDNRFIETVPKRGYRFVAEAVDASDSYFVERRTQTQITVQHDDDSQGVLSENASGFPRRSTPLTAIVVASLAIIICGAILLAYRPWSRSTQSENRNEIPAAVTALRAIAVLPLKNLTPKNADESLSVGLADALITRLGSMRALAVRPTSSVLQFAGQELSSQAIGEKLNVEAVLEGTVQLEGERVRIAVQLVSTRDAQIVWAGSFNEKFSDLFKIQDSFALQIADSLKANVGDEERARLSKRDTVDSSAFLLYLKGRHLWNQRSVESLKKSVEFFESAKSKDPDFALAYVGLADSHHLLSEYTSAPPKEMMEKARAEATKAIELDPELGEAHASLAYTLAFYDWNWKQAEAEFRHSIELKPNYATAHQWYSECLIALERYDDVYTQIKKAQELDPLSLIIATDVACYFYMTRQYERAIEESAKVVERDPKFFYGYVFMWLSFDKLGRIDEAADALFRCDGIFTPPDLIEAQRDAYVRGGWQALWRVRYEQANTAPMNSVFNDYHRALSALHFDDFEKTYYWLEKGYESRNRWFPNLKGDPEWDTFRSDPRYAGLVRKANL